MRSYFVYDTFAGKNSKQRLLKKNQAWFIANWSGNSLLQVSEGIATRITYALNMMEPVRSYMRHLRDVPIPKCASSLSGKEKPYYEFVSKSNCHWTALELLSKSDISHTPWSSIAKPILDWMKEIWNTESFFQEQKCPCILFDPSMNHSIVYIGKTKDTDNEVSIISFEKKWYNSSPFLLKKTPSADLKDFSYFYQPEQL